MPERYDSTAARHYTAYRPPLHALILDRVIHPHETFQVGLDVGCGTGNSAVALTKYCERVFGVDPSISMLDSAQKHPRITYIQGSGDALDQIPVQMFDIVTFAGSLCYAKTNQLRRELVRVCPPGTTVLVYDFCMRFHEVMADLEAELPAMASHYDHRANLSDWREFIPDSSGMKQLRLDVTRNQMAHLLLADSIRYDGLIKRFPNSDPFAALVSYFETSGTPMQLDADIYFTRYRILAV